MGPGPQSFAKACNQGRSNYLAEQLPRGPEAVYQAVMSPRIVCRPQRPRFSCACLASQSPAWGEGLLIPVGPAAQRLLGPGESVWSQVVANQPGSGMASELWKQVPKQRGIWGGTCGADSLSQKKTPTHEWQPPSPPHRGSATFPLLHLHPRHSVTGSQLFLSPLPLPSLSPGQLASVQPQKLLPASPPKPPAQHLAAVTRLHLASCWLSGPGPAGGARESQWLACGSGSVALEAPLEEKPRVSESWVLWPEQCVRAAGRSGGRSWMGPPSLNGPATPPVRMGPQVLRDSRINKRPVGATGG